MIADSSTSTINNEKLVINNSHSPVNMKQAKTKHTLQLWFVILAAICLFIKAHNHTPDFFQLDYSPDPQEEQWVDSVFTAMSPEQRLGQLFMIRAHSDLGADHIAKVERLIKKYHVGSLCFFQGTPEKQVELSNRYQKLSPHMPLMIAIDGEWGLGMRMKASTVSFPRQLMLGAIQDNRLIYEMGKEIAHDLKRIGVHINFAPVADVNNNSQNPVINFRSFGEDRYNVAVKSYMYMKGMQDHGILACAKHFPGHGDTNVDSHYGLPVIKHSKERLDSIELYPFRTLVEQGISSVMVAHLQVPILDDRENRPTTLSQNTITKLLKEELGFEGIIFTDALEMKGVTSHFKSGEVEAEALLAGNDILCLPEDIGAATKEIQNYIDSGRFSQERLDQSIRKILRAKYRLGLNRYHKIEQNNVRAEVNRPAATALKRKLIANAITLVRNKNNIVPFEGLDSLSIASLSIGAKSTTKFQERLQVYTQMVHFQSSKSISNQEQEKLIRVLENKDIVIVGLHNMSSRASKNFGITAETRKLIKALQQKTKVVLAVFGNPYSLKYFDDVDWLIEAYDEDQITQDLTAQAIFGAISFKGKLPVTASTKSRFQTGITTKAKFRLGYDLPENVGMNSDTLKRIGQLAQEAIKQRATPGCVILAVKDGKVVYHEAFGHHTYAKKQAMQKTDIFDLASVTKIAAATISVMKLVDEGLIDVHAPLSKYLPELKGSNKSKMLIGDMLAHRAGLQDWIPFFEQTVTKSRRNPRPMQSFYKVEEKEHFNIPVTDRLYLRQDFVDSIWHQIIHSEMRETKEYHYSDLGFYLVARLVNKLTGKSINQYAQETFYGPLCLQKTTYNPWQRFSRAEIVPTEEDKYFRRQRIQGYVHDMGAAMLGGVSGHAGLFASANDLAIIMQMLLQQGHYGDRQLLKPETIEIFTTRHNQGTRRGLGFDMLQMDTTYSPNISTKASLRAFGHLGFTGTSAWADPAHNLIYIFLSNRTYPSMHNYKLNKMDFRPRIQEILYNAIMEEG